MMEPERSDTFAHPLAKDFNPAQHSLAQTLLRAVMKVPNVMKVNPDELTGDPVRRESINACYGNAERNRIAA